jgi:hypothetical protein
MGDIYGVSNAVMEANSLHGQIALNAQLAKTNYQSKLDSFHKTIRDAKSKDSTANDEEIGKDLPDLGNVYQVGKGIAGGISGAVEGGTDAYNLARAGVASAASRTAPSVVDTATGGLSEAAQSSFLAESSAVSAGEAATEGAGVARSAGAALAGGAKGFVTGAAEAGGEGGVTGVGAIVKGTITKIGGEGGEALGEVAGRAAGALGGIIAGGEQIDSLIESGGKSAFTRVNNQGQRVAMSGVDKASEFLNEAGGVADILAASTGGLLVPVAAALNLAGAITGVVGSYMDEKADDKQIGLNSDGTTDASKAPKMAAQPISEAFTGLGFVGNMSHNPLAHIS